MSEIKDYSVELQKLYLEFLVNDSTLLSRTNNIISPDYFDVSIRSAVKFVIDYQNEYNTVPKTDQIKATTKVDLREIGEINEEHGKWFLNEFEQFCKYKALEKAIVKSADLLEKQEYGKVEKLIKDAVEIGLAKTFGTDYFADPLARLNELRNRNAATSTGWKSIDEKLYGGFDRGTLNIFAAPSGGGKSLFLQNLALNWSLTGMNVAYISLELSEGLCSLRMDAMLTATSTRDIYKNLDDVDFKVRMAGKKSGKLQIVQLPSGITVNDLKAWMKEYQIQKGIKLDAIVVDYMDLMMPASQKISLADLFIKDKLVSEELRNMSIESNIFCVTANQLNRCIFVDTLVEVNGKYIPIKDVKVGDYLRSNQGPVKVLEVLPSSKQAVFEIKMKSGKTIKCNATHMFPTKDGLKTLETGLKVGDKLQIFKDNT
jgi:archaellum biogenesis ATPase FlaH